MLSQDKSKPKNITKVLLNYVNADSIDTGAAAENLETMAVRNDEAIWQRQPLAWRVEALLPKNFATPQSTD